MAEKIIIHYNKAHNADQSIPPWVVKSHGETHYVSHVSISPGIGFSTKETPSHSSTKASIVVKGTLSIENGEAFIS